MLIRTRGWDRNHGWRDIARHSLRRAREVSADWRLGEDEAIVEPSDIPADQRVGGAVNVYFRAEIQNPALNGNYMMNVRFSKGDAARIFRTAMRGASASYMLQLLNEVEDREEVEE